MTLESLVTTSPSAQAMLKDHSSRQDEAQVHPSWLQIACWAGIVGVMLILSLSAFDAFQLGALGDDARYYILAQSLLRSQHYGLIFSPGLPEATHYPFGFPLLLAPLVALMPGNLDALNLVPLGATLLNAALLFWGWRQMSRRSQWWAVAITGLYLFSPVVVTHSRMVMSEPVFTTFCLSALFSTMRLVRGQGGFWTRALLSVSLFFALSVSAIGIMLVGVVVAYLIFQGKRAIWKRVASVAAGMALSLSLVLLLTPVAFSDLLPIQYFARYGSLESDTTGGMVPVTGTAEPATLSLAALRYHIATDLVQAVISTGGQSRTAAIGEAANVPAFPFLVGLSLLALILLGFIRWWRQGRYIWPLFALLYLAAPSLWYWQTPPLLYPVLPALFFGLLLGIEGVLCALLRLPRLAALAPYRAHILVILVVLLMTTGLYQSLDSDPSSIHVGNLVARSSWVKANTPSSAILLSEHPEVDYIYAGRKTVRPLESYASAEELERFLQDRRVSYLLIAPDIRWQDGPYTPNWSDQTVSLMSYVSQLAASQQLELIYSSTADKIQVYKRVQ